MVSIDLCPGLWGKVSVVNGETKEMLWQGKSGQTAEFEALDTMPIEIIWGILQTPNVKETINDGASYEMVFRMKPFGAEYFLVRKDLAQPDDMVPEG